jgi:SAM-dependent methyltransferase
VDWALGRYERIASDLLPAASAVVEKGAPGAGVRVLDVGCGTGNAALLAAERGAEVTGVDPAERLLELARRRADALGLDAVFARGDAGALPVPDGAADLVISVFGVIFAPDPTAAAAEMARVMAPSGAVVLSSWIPGGAIGAATRVRSEALAEATGGHAQAPAFAWHEADALAGLFAPHDFAVRVEEHPLAFTAASPERFLERELREHPAWVSARSILEPHGSWDRVCEEVLSILQLENEDPAGFRVTSRYVVASMLRA